MRISCYALMIAVAVVCVSLSGCSKKKSDDKDAGKYAPASVAQPETDAMDAAHVKRVQKLINDGLTYLLEQQGEDGGWRIGPGAKPAATAMALKALLQHPDYDTKHPMVRKGFEVLLSYRQLDGGIYDPNEGRANYTTSVALMAICAAKDPQFNEAKRRATAYLRGLLIRPGSKAPDGATITETHPMRGGVSYGEHGRPDLSNLGMWLQALHEAGVEGDDPDIQEALRFVTRTQNFTEKNSSKWAVAGSNDGGFIYAPAVKADLNVGESKAGEIPGDRGLRSYGSMTYMGFKSLLHANVDRDDPRIRAAFRWIRDYWRLDSNPNMPQDQRQEGLYYYYHVFAKALRAWGEPVIKDLKGGEHNWRHELIDAVAGRVEKDGSWINLKDRWYEGDRVLVTAYVVLALQECMKK